MIRKGQVCSSQARVQSPCIPTQPMNHMAREAKPEVMHPSAGQPPMVVSRGLGSLQITMGGHVKGKMDWFLTCTLINGVKREG